MSTNLEYRSIYLQRVDYKHICLFFCFFFVVFFVPESLLNPFGNVQFIQKSNYYSLKSLLLSKQHHQTTQPRSLLHKSMLEDNWNWGKVMCSPLWKDANFLAIIKLSFYRLKKYRFRKQHHQTTKPMSLLQNNSWAQKIIGIFTSNHGLNPLEKCIFLFLLL